MARPRKPEHLRRTIIVQTTVTPRERICLGKLAEARASTIAATLRSLFWEAYKREVAGAGE